MLSREFFAEGNKTFFPVTSVEKLIPTSSGLPFPEKSAVI
jgi:hypothetical protein